ncbi:hypothetical protein B484DRAFT_428956, partial [Ochromonadaceae sp. CCMP2298]
TNGDLQHVLDSYSMDRISDTASMPVDGSIIVVKTWPMGILPATQGSVAGAMESAQQLGNGSAGRISSCQSRPRCRGRKQNWHGPDRGLSDDKLVRAATHGQRQDSHGGMVDASNALVNAVEAVLRKGPNVGLQTLNCYFHVTAAMKKNKGLLDGDKVLYNMVKDDVRRMHLARSQEQFEALKIIIIDKWIAAGATSFAEYFRDTYLTGRFQYCWLPRNWEFL